MVKTFWMPPLILKHLLAANVANCERQANRATGLPALAMMTSFPFCTASMSADSSAFASEMLRITTLGFYHRPGLVWSAI